FRLAELLAAPVLAAQGRRPVSTPVIAAAVRRALDEEPGMFAPVAGHPATERALVASFAELSDLTDDASDARAPASPRARSVVGVYRRARAVLATDWYDESDLTAAAVAQVAANGDEVGPELARLVVHLPQDLLRLQAELLAALAAHLPTTVVVGVTGRPDADDGVARSLQRMGVPLPVPLRPAPEGANGATGDGTLPPLPVSVEGTRIVTASDADDEVRAAVRRVVDAVRAGTPLERIALLYGSPTPYARLVHEHLAAAGIPRNGAAVRPLAASVLGQTVLGLLALPDHDFRRSAAPGLLARGAAARGGSLAAACGRSSSTSSTASPRPAPRRHLGPSGWRGCATSSSGSRATGGTARAGRPTRCRRPRRSTPPSTGWPGSTASPTRRRSTCSAGRSSWSSRPTSAASAASARVSSSDRCRSRWASTSTSSSCWAWPR